MSEIKATENFYYYGIILILSMSSIQWKHFQKV